MRWEGDRQRGGYDLRGGYEVGGRQAEGGGGTT